jgi:hypothetical protein
VHAPSFTAEMLRICLAKVPPDDHENLIFFSPNGTPLRINHVRRRLRAVAVRSRYRRGDPARFAPRVLGVRDKVMGTATVATVLDTAGGADLAAQMLEHFVRHLQMHCFELEGAENPVIAEILESLAPRSTDGEL